MYNVQCTNVEGVAYGKTHQILPLAIFAMAVFATRTDFKCYREAQGFVGASGWAVLLCHAELVEASLPRSGKAERSSAILFADCGNKSKYTQAIHCIKRQKNKAKCKPQKRTARKKCHPGESSQHFKQTALNNRIQ